MTSDSSPGAVISSSTGLVSVFVQGPDDSLDTYWATPGLSQWSGPLQVGGPGSTDSRAAAVINRSTGLVSVFVQGPGNSLDTYWATPGLSQWSGPLQLRPTCVLPEPIWILALPKRMRRRCAELCAWKPSPDAVTR